MTPDELLPQVYDELRKLAAGKMRHERDDHTLDATALVNEAWLKLNAETYSSRSQFLRAAAVAMRRILVDYARARQADKRGGNGNRVVLESHHLASWPPNEDVEALDETLARFAVEFPKQAELVQLRYFGGLTLEECAEVLGVSARTADSWWSYSRAWLAVELHKS